MNRKSIIFQWSLVILILINVVIVITMLLNPKQKRPKHPGETLVKELNFTPEQKEQYKELSKQHFNKARQNRKHMREAKDKLFNSISGGLTPTELDSLTSVIGNLEKQLDILTYQHFSRVYKICDEQQKVKFKELLNDVLHKNGPNGKGHHQPRRK